MAIDSGLLPSAVTAPLPKMTYEEFLVCMDGIHAEWVDGEVLVMSPASNQHQDLADFLTSLLRHFAEAYEAGVVRSAPLQMKIAPDMPGREPDILFLASAHLDRLRPNNIVGPADLVVEIISPESVERDRGEKFQEYEQGGVREYWLLDPIRQQPEFYQRDDRGFFQMTPPDANGVYRSAVLPGLWLDVNWLWATPLPTLMSVLKAWGLVPS